MDEFGQFLQAVEINPTELCNLQCTFCPRAHGYPNQNLHMSIETAKTIRQQLEDIKFAGKIYIAGRGEPTLTKNFPEILRVFLESSPRYEVTVTTNGKRIDDCEEFYGHPNLQIKYDLYATDVKEQERVYKKYGDVPNLKINKKPDWGLLYNDLPSGVGEFKQLKRESQGNLQGLTNRGGFLGETGYEITDASCVKVLTIIYINWNGEYNLCCDDWEPISLSNIWEESIADYVENNLILNKYREQLICQNSREDLHACSNCNRNSPVKNEDKEKVNFIFKMREMTDD